MKFAIRIPTTGDIVRQGITIEEAKYHIRVNPLHILVKKTAKGWKTVDNNELFGIKKP